jgi:putative methanogen marker protein 4
MAERVKNVSDQTSNPMNLIEALKNSAKSKKSKIAIGAGSERAGYLEKVVRAAEECENVVVVGDSRIKGISSEVEYVESRNVERDLINLLEEGVVDAIVRGSARAKEFLASIRESFNPERLARIAILETPSEKSFLFAPVGIDEGWTIAEKRFIIEEGSKILESLGLTPKIGILSGGRQQDYGRHKIVDKTLKNAEKLAAYYKNATNYSILIEDAIEDNANLIIPPNGIVGNLIFRTLVFLGNGRGYGAPIVGVERPCIDTSRAQSKEGYIRAIMTAKALS